MEILREWIDLSQVHLSLGLYLFTLKYSTRTCGPLSLCGPTTVSMIRNGEIVKTFSTNVASQKNHDFDLVIMILLTLTHPLLPFKQKLPLEKLDAI